MTEKKIALTVQEAAETISLHPNTVYALIAKGRLPAIRLGRKYLISRIELEKWVADGGKPCKEGYRHGDYTASEIQ